MHICPKVCNIRSNFFTMGAGKPEFQEELNSSTVLGEPRRFRVLLHNDNYTTMEFVVEVLESVFNKNAPEATSIMLNVHKQGIGVCGVFTAEVAETKVAIVHHLARQRNFPLRCSMEEVS
jgi:ATP-dependent Clp protease adaptor protein ClpS